MNVKAHHVIKQLHVLIRLMVTGMLFLTIIRQFSQQNPENIMANKIQRILCSSACECCAPWACLCEQVKATPVKIADAQPAHRAPLLSIFWKAWTMSLVLCSDITLAVDRLQYHQSTRARVEKCRFSPLMDQLVLLMPLLVCFIGNMSFYFFLYLHLQLFVWKWIWGFIVWWRDWWVSIFTLWTWSNMHRSPQSLQLPMSTSFFWQFVSNKYDALTFLSIILYCKSHYHTIQYSRKQIKKDAENTDMYLF